MTVPCPCCQAPVEPPAAASGRLMRCPSCRAFLRIGPDGSRLVPLRQERLATPPPPASIAETAALLGGPHAGAQEILEALRKNQGEGRTEVVDKIAGMLANRTPLDSFDIEMMKIRSTTIGGGSRSKAGKAEAGPYQLGEVLGRGRSSVVHRAPDARGGPDRAIKLLLATRGSDTRVRRLFEIEIDSLRTLVHPNLVRILESGEYEGHFCYAMELVRGRTFDALLTEATPLEERVLPIVQALEGVATAHAAGLHHGNLKPSNLLIDEEGHARVSDFALVLGSGAPREEDSPYLAPEQEGQRGRAAGPAADVWGFGVLLHQALWLVLPARRPKRPPRTGAVPAGLAAVCMKALSVDPADRYPDALAFASDLTRALTGEATEARPSGWLRRLWGR